ncbi:TlpA disulfide reductase family protein [Spirosoma validum]|uniref:Redoxin family protein n=1 Tax=Spirosoma validum TaxID=2771355 RepID=A0A927B9C3_9BACT|nr:TlpA disulfide reductase family protein [Spirosoma validum]MBD2757890.1 redoxin family protein [Spirosoma validum]
MKTTHFFLVTLLFFTNFIGYGQKPQSIKPFVIKGKISNTKESKFILFFRDKSTQYKDYTIEEINLDKEGSFRLETRKVDRPMMATLRQNDLSTNLYIAPGYELTFNADGKDYASFFKSKSLSGKGSQNSNYLFAWDVLQFNRRNDTPWFDLKEKQLLSFVKRDQAVRDSLFNASFRPGNTNDKWFSYFKNSTRLDNHFMKLYYLISYVNNDSSFTYQKSVSFVKDNYDRMVLENLYNDDYLVSENYISWLMGTYSSYLRTLDCRRVPNYCNEAKKEAQIIQQIATHYQGAIREIKLYTKLDQSIRYAGSIEELSRVKKEFVPYVSSLVSVKDREKIEQLLSTTALSLLKTEIGKPAPVFVIEDSVGNQYSLGNYKGKVVYLDLWASWCGPCRVETTHLKTIAKKYKHDDRVVFISIAVHDKVENWKRALRKDTPDWLQLFDQNGKVQNLYSASAIPKFILVDKQGNIVSFDAAKPSSGANLEAMINRELSK